MNPVAVVIQVVGRVDVSIVVTIVISVFQTRGDDLVAIKRPLVELVGESPRVCHFPLAYVTAADKDASSAAVPHCESSVGRVDASLSALGRGNKYLCAVIRS